MADNGQSITVRISAVRSNIFLLKISSILINVAFVLTGHWSMSNLMSYWPVARKDYGPNCKIVIEGLPTASYILFLALN